MTRDAVSGRTVTTKESTPIMDASENFRASCLCRYRDILTASSRPSYETPPRPSGCFNFGAFDRIVFEDA
jgi:hypothetical protein